MKTHLAKVSLNAMKRLAFIAPAAMVLSGCQETTQPADSSQPMFSHGPPNNPGPPGEPGPREPPDDLGPPDDPGAPTFCVTPPSGLVSWWPGDGNADDIIGTNNGTPEGNVTFTSGKVGQAFSFDGTGGVPTPVPTSYATGATFDVWVRQTTAQVAFSGTVMTDGGGSTPQKGMGLFMEDGNINLYVSTDPNPLAIVFGPAIADGTYHHVAATWTGDATSDGIKLYVDGAPAGEGTASGFITSSSQTLQMGRHNMVGFFPLKGDVDEVDLFNRALSATEIQAIFNAGSAGKCK